MIRVFRTSFNLNSRNYSIKEATKNVKKYTDTINLPKTKFPSRLTPAKRTEVEQNLLKRTLAPSYRYQEQHKAEPTFVLHDGPPYANGELHMGHAVNKILKDITLRQHVAKGQRINYIAGWDCHGLPIELKATTSNSTQSALSIRQKSRQFALDAIESQKHEFRSWGILSDWQPEHIYLTFQPEFIANQLKMFYALFKRGLVYRDLKPVYWSPSSKTALAEAELEYDQNFASPSIYVRFLLNNLPSTIPKNVQQVYALVWTTTPWTLPSNQAICYNDKLDYALVKLTDVNGNASSDELYIIAKALIQDFESATKLKCDVVHNLEGSSLTDCTYRHPIDQTADNLPFFAATHVQDTKGTGLVHTAPAHGPEDFLVSLVEKLPVKNFVNESGVYTADAPEFLRGKKVLEEGNPLVLKHIAQDIVSSNTFIHAYPIDWRTKKPVIIRASEQWFINTEILKARAVEEIEKIQFYPRVNAESSKKTLIAQVRKRPYWCISRQRAWGVPIPVLYEKQTGKVVTNEKLIAHFCSLLQKEGTIDFWWSKSIAELIPQSILHELKMTADELVKGTDIFDIWFDSGSTWSAVLGKETVADVYIEGHDQFTGWFQSSLLTSIAARDYAPYKALFVHGFTVDEKGHKMSKSLGNVISPKDITKKYGTDVLRWWVASHGTQNMSITVSDKLLQQAAESLSKIRGTLRYLNGVIGVQQIKQNDDVQPALVCHLNEYLLSTLVDFETEVLKLYDNYEYNRVVATIQNYVANQISAIYVHLIKDRLYCGNDAELDSIRYTLKECYVQLCKALYPITPFLVEESWSYYSPDAGFHEAAFKAQEHWKNHKIEQIMHTALDVKRLINQQAGDVNTWTLAVRLICDNVAQLKELQLLQNTLEQPVYDSQLCEILQVGSVSLNPSTKSGSGFQLELEELQQTLCPRCRRYAVQSNMETCVRCTQVLNTK